MTGIYKIISPSGKIYIGQSINIAKRTKNYSNQRCRAQTRLHASLVKYGFSEHIFEVVEECRVELLNERERYWQDVYNVLGEEGLTCRLTGTNDKSGYHSQDSKDRNSVSQKAFFSTAEGKQSKMRGSLSRKVFNKTQEGVESRTRQTASRNQQAIARKLWKPILQFTKDGTFIKEWSSGKEAGETLGILRTGISTCLTGRSKSAHGFIWKYK